MKKFLLLGAMGVLLTGCAGSGDTDESDSKDSAAPALEQNEANTPPESEQEAEQQASEQADADDGASGDSAVSDDSANSGTQAADPALEGYEEYSTVREAADIDGMKGIVETDNPGTRVILYEDGNGVKKVKSIFVKKENRLKVISLDDDGLLYNDILK